MKKRFIVGLAMFLCFSGLTFADPATIAAVTSAMVKGGAEIYKALPNAEYVITWFAEDGRCDYGKEDSYIAAKALANKALSCGATKVHVQSVVAWRSVDEWFPPETPPNAAYVPGIIW